MSTQAESSGKEKAPIYLLVPWAHFNQALHLPCVSHCDWHRGWTELEFYLHRKPVMKLPGVSVLPSPVKLVAAQFLSYNEASVKLKTLGT